MNKRSAGLAVALAGIGTGLTIALPSFYKLTDVSCIPAFFGPIIGVLFYRVFSGKGVTRKEGRGLGAAVGLIAALVISVFLGIADHIAWRVLYPFEERKHMREVLGSMLIRLDPFSGNPTSFETSVFIYIVMFSLIGSFLGWFSSGFFTLTEGSKKPQNPKQKDKRKTKRSERIL